MIYFKALEFFMLNIMRYVIAASDSLHAYKNNVNPRIASYVGTM